MSRICTLIRILAPSAPLLLASLVTAQPPCQPTWDTAVGNPGITSGYAGAFGVWNDGNGDQLYVGGSFDGISGVGGTQLLAAWNRTTHVWSSVGGGLSTGFTN